MLGQLTMCADSSTLSLVQPRCTELELEPRELEPRESSFITCVWNDV